MPDAYQQLLDATIEHLETLKARGVRSVPVGRETLSAFAKAPARSTGSGQAAPPAA